MDGLELGITYLGEGGWHGVDERSGESASSTDSGVGRGAFRNGRIVGKQFNCFENGFSLSFWDVHLVAPLVFRGAADVPSGDAMG